MENNIKYVSAPFIEKISSNEIEQKDNFNSYSSLFIYEEKVYKIYEDCFDKVKYNLEILKLLLKYKVYLKNIKELVLPEQLLSYKGHIIGFIMPYIKGNTLYDIINSKSYSTEYIKTIFIKIVKSIDKLNELPFKISLSDLHEKNVIVDADNNIHLIDCDGFSINNKQMISDGKIVLGKYLNKQDDEELKNIGISGDYYCLFCMILNYIFENKYESELDFEGIIKYIDDEYLNNLYKRTLNLKSFKLTKNDIDMLFSKIEFYRKRYKDYSDRNKELLEQELLRIRKIIRNQIQ